IATTSPSFTGTLPANSSTGVVSINNANPGTWTITVTATDNCSATDSKQFTLTVGQYSSTTSVSTSGSPSTFGNSVTFTATVTTGATGTVTFKDGVNTLGPGTISGNTATFSTSALTGGAHSIAAVYNGDTNYSGSNSLAIT